MINRAIAAAVLLLAGSALSAQTITIGNAAVQAGSASAVVPITFDPGASSIVDYSVSFTFSRGFPVAATGNVQVTNADGACGGPGVSDPTGTQINFSDGGGGVLPAGTTCTLTFPLNPASPLGSYPFVVTFAEFSDGGGVVPGMVFPGGITIFDGGPANTPPTLSYLPAPGQTVEFPGSGGQLLNATIAVSGSAGSGSGATSTARVTNCQVSPPFSPPVFNCTPGGGMNLDFLPGVDPGDINCSCQAPVVGVETATLTCEEIRPLSASVPVTRSWNLTCPGTAGQCGVLSFAPPEGVVAFSAGSASIVVTHAVGTTGVNTTFNGCAVGGANADNFTITNSPISFNFPGGASNEGTISLSCNNATTTDVTATLTCNQICDGTTPHNWTLSCPGQTAPPPTEEAVPVPTLGDLSRILMAAMLLLIGMGAVTLRSRG